MYFDKDGRIFHHHEKWEDWRNGLFNKSKKRIDKINLSRKILNNIEKCDEFFSRVFLEWPFCSDVNLSNRNINRQAWLGQAACCLSHGANEDETKEAWFTLSKEEQYRANTIADYYILKFETEKMKNAENLSRNRRFSRCTRTYNMDI